MMFVQRIAAGTIAWLCAATCFAQEKRTTLDAVRALEPAVFAAQSEQAKQLTAAVGDNLRARRDVANRGATAAWRSIKTREDWEAFREPRIAALKKSLGDYPPPAKDLKIRVTCGHEGDGFVVENVVYESRPGVLVTANLYRPRAPLPSPRKGEGTARGPGILICHSHHNPKTQGELQDMGMTWARLGCVVLVMDQLGHGERRQHPFVDEKSYPGAFKPGRQDYYFRYNVGMQLHLIGDSLIGWMVWDLMRGVDLLAQRQDVDPQRIILLGAVAGGGDPAAVTAAIDPRIAAVVPFNFGGPQPENRVPLPADAEDAFNYAGGGSWESTRSLRLSCRDGFLPWVIVGAAVPRGLVYAHEFAWDRDRDPVWKRFQTIYALHKSERLAYVHGSGSVKGTGPGNTHCNNIGPVHRAPLYPAFKHWFGMPAPDKEYQNRLASKELQCLTADIEMTPACEIVRGIAVQRMQAARAAVQKMPEQQRPLSLAKTWCALLGGVNATERKRVMVRNDTRGDVVAEYFVLLEDAVAAEPPIPVVLLMPRTAKGRLPVVVAVAQEGKQAFLQQRAFEIAELLDSGVGVCLPDVRGTGEGRTGDSRGRSSADTSYSSLALMLGDTMVGARLRDVRTVLASLRAHPRIDGKKIGIWGDSFAQVNAAAARLAVPLDAAELPAQSEPLGGLLALFTALFELDVQAACVRGGLVGYESVLHSPFCYVPHDAIVPGALTTGDLCDVAAALAPRPLRIENLVDGLNRVVDRAALSRSYEPATNAYRQRGAADQFALQTANEERVAAWFVRQLRPD